MDRKGKAEVPHHHHAMKAYRRSIALLILNITNICRWIINKNPQLNNPKVRTPFPIEWEGWWASEPAWTFWGRVKSHTLHYITPAGFQSLDYLAHSLVAKLTAIPTPNLMVSLKAIWEHHTFQTLALDRGWMVSLTPPGQSTSMHFRSIHLLITTNHMHSLLHIEQLYSDIFQHEYHKHVEALSTFIILDGSQTLPGHCRKQQENFLPLPGNNSIGRRYSCYSLPFSSGLHQQSASSTSFTNLRILCAGCPGLMLINNLALLLFLVDSL